MQETNYTYTKLSDFNMKLAPWVPLVHQLLRNRVGRFRSLKARAICHLIPEINQRKMSRDNLNDIIELLRCQPFPIISNSYYGYWWAENKKEWDQFTNRRRQSLKRQLRTVYFGKKVTDFPRPMPEPLMNQTTLDLLIIPTGGLKNVG